MFANLLLVINNDKLNSVNEKLPSLMTEYYEGVDMVERKRLRENAKNRF